MNKFLSGFDESTNLNEEKKQSSEGGSKSKTPEAAPAYSYTASMMGGLSSIYKWTRGENSSKDRKKEKDLNFIDD